MVEIVFAGSLSHAPAATGWAEKATEKERRNFHNAAKKIGDEIIASKADVVIGIANDHVLNYNLRNFPNFAIGIGEEHSGPADWFKSWLKVPDFNLKGDPTIA